MQSVKQESAEDECLKPVKQEKIDHDHPQAQQQCIKEEQPTQDSQQPQPCQKSQQEGEQRQQAKDEPQQQQQEQTQQKGKGQAQQQQQQQQQDCGIQTAEHGSSSSGMLAARAYSGPYPTWGAPTAAACRHVAERLAAVHGWPSLQRRANPGQPQVGCEEKRTVLDSLVRTLLSQNTTDITSQRAFNTLKHQFPSWDAVRQAPLSEVADAIRVGGLAEIKAGRIQAILFTLVAERGECSLEHLRAAPTPEVKAELARFKGVGKKTVSCVLLFALERQDLAVDTHVWEITKALAWVPLNASRDQAYDHLNELLPDELKYDLHVLLVRHGKACPSCAKAGSAKAKAAGGAAAGDCPLADLKPPRGQLKSLKAVSAASTAGKGKQREGSEGGRAVADKAAGKAAAVGGGKKWQKVSAD